MSNFRRVCAFTFILCLFAVVCYGTGSRVHKGIVLQAQSSTCPPACDWPQVGRDPQHTGYSPETVGTNFQIRWRKAFQPDKLNPKVQPIVGQGSDSIFRVYIGTEGANGQPPTLWAFDATSGNVSWKQSLNGSILGSVAVVNNNVYVGDLSGDVTAFNAVNGALVWKKQLSSTVGISASLVLADGKLIVPVRNGMVSALDLSNGTILWTYNTGSPVLNTPAANGQKIYVAAMDMTVHAINSTNGTRVWKSARLTGYGMNDYYPVVTAGKVIVRLVGGPDWNLVPSSYTSAAQDALLAQASTRKRSMIIFNESDGSEALPVIFGDNQTMNGATAPPCLDKDANIIVPIPAEGSWQSGWGRVSLSTRKIVDLLSDGTLTNGVPTGYGNPDENLAVSCTANGIFSMHVEEANANYTGFFDLTNKKWFPINTGTTNLEMMTNTQGGGTNAATVANGWIYHISVHELIARSTN